MRSCTIICVHKYGLTQVRPCVTMCHKFYLRRLSQQAPSTIGAKPAPASTPAPAAPSKPVSARSAASTLVDDLIGLGSDKKSKKSKKSSRRRDDDDDASSDDLSVDGRGSGGGPRGIDIDDADADHSQNMAAAFLAPNAVEANSAAADEDVLVFE
jgi:hypothetical protein